MSHKNHFFAVTEFDDSQVLKTSAGSIQQCSGTQSETTGLGYNRNNGMIDLGGRIITESKTTDCQATVHWNESLADCSTDHCKFTEVYKVKNPSIVRDSNKFSLVDAQMLHVKESEVPASLKEKQFQVL